MLLSNNVFVWVIRCNMLTVVMKQFHKVEISFSDILNMVVKAVKQPPSANNSFSKQVDSALF